MLAGNELSAAAKAEMGGTKLTNNSGAASMYEEQLSSAWVRMALVLGERWDAFFPGERLYAPPSRILLQSSAMERTLSTRTAFCATAAMTAFDSSIFMVAHGRRTA